MPPRSRSPTEIAGVPPRPTLDPLIFDSPTMREGLARAASVGRQAWPEFDLPAAALSHHLVTRLRSDDPLSELETLNVADLYLACACERGLGPALSAFEKKMLKPALRAAARVDPDRAQGGDLQQVLLERLFVRRDGQPPKITEYSGRGPLAAWMRTVALGTAVSLRRRHRPQLPLFEEELANRFSAVADAETQLIKAQHRQTFSVAFAQALATITTKERLVLRLHWLQGLSIDQLGDLYGAHRSTAARWIADARAKLLKRLRSLLAEELRLAPQELESLIRFLKTELEVTSSMFASRHPAGGIPARQSVGRKK